MDGGASLKYSKQMILDLSAHLSNYTVEFFNEHCIDFLIKDLQDFVESILDEYYPDVDKISMRDSAEKIRRSHYKKRCRWYDGYKDNVQKYSDISDKRSIFNLYYIQKEVLNSSQWHALYGDVSLDELIENKKTETETWKNTKNSSLITFPLILTKRPAYIYSALRMDVALEIYSIVKKNYSGNLNNFFRTYPKELVNYPLFSNSKKSELSVKEYAGQLVSDFFPEGETYSSPFLRTVIRKGANEILNSLDAEDLTIVSMFLTNIDNNFYSSKEVTVDLIDIARAVYQVDNPSAWHYQQISDRCLNLVACNYQYYDEDHKSGVSFNFFDNVKIPFSEKYSKQTVTVEFGSLLYNALVDHKLVNVTYKNYNALENKLSKICYYALQLKRIELGLSNRTSGSNMIYTFPYSFFQYTAQLRSGGRRANTRLINEMLTEFCEKKIAIKNFTYANSCWTVEFSPLSDEEYEDLKFEQTPYIISTQ